MNFHSYTIARKPASLLLSNGRCHQAHTILAQIRKIALVFDVVSRYQMKKHFSLEMVLFFYFLPLHRKSRKQIIVCGSNNQKFLFRFTRKSNHVCAFILIEIISATIKNISILGIHFYYHITICTFRTF